MITFEDFFNQFSLSKEQFIQLKKQFNRFKNKVQLEATIDKHKLKNNILIVTAKITIEQFRNWLALHANKSKLISTRKFWYLFIDYAEEIFNYGYYFDNINKINRFLPESKNWLRPVDYLIKDLPYNICAMAVVSNFKVANDKNSFTFDILTEGYRKKEEIDNNIVNSSLVVESINKTDEKEEEIKIETKAEEMKRLIDQYKDTGVAHAHIAYELVKQNQNELTDIDFIKQMGLIPKIIKYWSKEKNIIIVEFAITKRQFIQDFSLFRSSPDIDQVWNDFQKDFSINAKQYLLKYVINIPYKEKINNIYDINISKPNSIKFCSDLIK